jgi:hypothetical protein
MCAGTPTNVAVSFAAAEHSGRAWFIIVAFSLRGMR